MLSSALLSLAAVLATSFLHLEAMRWISGPMAAIPLRPRHRVHIAVLILFAAHMAEIGVYALAFAIAQGQLGLGEFFGETVAQPLDYLYFSAISYTSLGIGDIFPSEHLRLLTGVEALNGLLLIAWSSAFLFSMMSRLWRWQPCVAPERRPMRRK